MMHISGFIFSALCCIYSAAYCVRVFRNGNAKAGVISLGMIALTAFAVLRLALL